MAREQAIVITLILLSAGLVATPARADAPLVADAGDSRLASDGTVALSGAAFGGAAPYSYQWSWSGDAARLANATSAQATLDTSGLPAQDVVVTLTVTDADGAVASDTVRHRVDSSPVLVRRNVTFTYGVPDELVGERADSRPVFFQVPAGLARMVATLDWSDPNYDLDFELLDPTGAVVGGTSGQSAARPERIVVDAPIEGGWQARILPFLSGPTTATLTVEGPSGGALPSVSTAASYVYGQQDAQRLAASVAGGVAPLALAWDLDGDGVFEAPGAEVVAALPVGVHAVRVRATDAAGFEATATTMLDVRASDTVLRLRCGNDATTPYWAMEFTSTKGSCWIHGGHHTYFMGDTEFALKALSGFVFTVEQQFSPPTEHSTESPGATPLHLEISRDGITWTEVAHGEYRFLPDVLNGDLAVQERQRVDITAAGASEAFRFVRVSEPLSAAQGLSGYLDHSEMDVEADVLGHVEPGARAQRVRVMDCLAGDHMEDFFLAHPCWFGGIDRYDAPSFWHTYPLGEGATLDAIVGEFTLAPWRLDDWTQGNATTNATNVSARVQTSVDGVHWTDVATLPTTFGVPTPFVVLLDDHEARFVRLFPEYHARFDQTAEFAPNHHPKGYFVDSRITVEGLLPVA